MPFAAFLFRLLSGEGGGGRAEEEEEGDLPPVWRGSVPCFPLVFLPRSPPCLLTCCWKETLRVFRSLGRRKPSSCGCCSPLDCRGVSGALLAAGPPLLWLDLVLCWGAENEEEEAGGGEETEAGACGWEAVGVVLESPFFRLCLIPLFPSPLRSSISCRRCSSFSRSRRWSSAIRSVVS